MKAVIFDIDGTLVDSVNLHARSWQEALAHFGHPVPFDQVRAQIGKGGDQIMPVFLSPSEVESRGPDLERYRGELFKRNYLGQVRAFPQVRELFLKLLDDGWRIALASSAKSDEVEAYKEICRVGDLIEAETSSDDAERSKPHPDIFQAAVARLDVAPNECMVVGDSPYDAEAAAKAGAISIGLLCGGFAPEALTAAGFLNLYQDPSDLAAHYEQSFLKEHRPHIAEFT